MLLMIFDGVFTNIIIPMFKVARESNQSIAYSNWTKSNTGFSSIRRFINTNVFDLKQDYLINLVADYFVKINEETENANIDRYVDYCKKNKKIKAKDGMGFELSENDVALRNALQIYRFNYATEKHKSESSIFTDKMLDRIVFEKPVTKDALKKIVSDYTVYYCGDDIIKIVAENI